MPLTRFGRRALIGAAGLLAASGRARAGEDAIRIGVLNDPDGLSRDSGGLGSVTAAEMAAQDFGGTVLGRRIEILHAATQNKPDVGSAIARQWYDAGVDAITDLPVTPVAAAVQQLAREKQRTVMITAAAVSEFTSRSCAPVSSHWIDDTHAMAIGTGRLVTRAVGGTWFFITVDYSFGHALQAATTREIEAAGGKVVGSAMFPMGSSDFSAQVVQAQNSGAKVVGLVAVVADLVNLVKQASEFGLQTRGAQTLASFLVYITDIHALGLQVAQGLSFPAGFYWDQNEAARGFAKRFQAARNAMPSKTQAATYAATLHFLKAMTQAGTRDPVTVNKAMRAMPVAYVGRPATLRGDGRLLYDVSLYRVKRPQDSKGPWDYYADVGTLPAAEAFLPMNPACAA